MSDRIADKTTRNSTGDASFSKRFQMVCALLILLLFQNCHFLGNIKGICRELAAFGKNF